MKNGSGALDALRRFGLVVLIAMSLACGKERLLVASRVESETPGAPPSSTVPVERDAGPKPIEPSTRNEDAPVLQRDQMDGGSVATPVVSIDNTAGDTLSGYSVLVRAERAALVANGVSLAECCAVRARSLAQCNEVIPAWLDPDSCDEPWLDIWLRVSLAQGDVLNVALSFACGAEAPASGPEGIFEFYEGFDAPLDPRRWNTYVELPGYAEVSDGVLHADLGPVMIEAVSTLMTAGGHVLGASVAMTTGELDDFEIGGGRMITVPPIWHERRQWTGVGYVAWAYTGSSLSTGPDSTCPKFVEFIIGETFITPPDQRLLVEFGYELQGSRTAYWVTASNGLSFNTVSPEGCAVPTQLPPYLVLDNSLEGQNPYHRVYYLYLRKFTAAPPLVDLQWRKAPECQR